MTNFCTPVVYNNPQGLCQNLGNACNNYLSLCGRDVAVITDITPEGKHIYEIQNREGSCMSTGVKVATLSLSLGLLGVIALIGKLIQKAFLDLELKAPVQASPVEETTAEVEVEVKKPVVPMRPRLERGNSESDLSELKNASSHAPLKRVNSQNDLASSNPDFQAYLKDRECEKEGEPIADFLESFNNEEMIEITEAPQQPEGHLTKVRQRAIGAGAALIGSAYNIAKSIGRLAQNALNDNKPVDQDLFEDVERQDSDNDMLILV